MFLPKNEERAIIRRFRRQTIEAGIEAKADTARELAVELEFENPYGMSLARLYRMLDSRGYVYSVYAEVWTLKQ